MYSLASMNRIEYISCHFSYSNVRYFGRDAHHVYCV